MTELLFAKYEKELNEFQEWLKSQPQLPTNIGEFCFHVSCVTWNFPSFPTYLNTGIVYLTFIEKLLLLRYLKVYDFDLEKAKELLLLNLETRKNNPNIFLNRDVLDDGYQQAFKTFQIFPMPKSTPENYKITISRLLITDPDKYVYIDVIRSVVAMLDTRFVTLDDSNELIDGEIGINDMVCNSYFYNST